MKGEDVNLQVQLDKGFFIKEIIFKNGIVWNL